MINKEMTLKAVAMLTNFYHMNHKKTKNFAKKFYYEKKQFGRLAFAYRLKFLDTITAEQQNLMTLSAAYENIKKLRRGTDKILDYVKKNKAKLIKTPPKSQRVLFLEFFFSKHFDRINISKS